MGKPLRERAVPLAACGLVIRVAHCVHQRECGGNLLDKQLMYRHPQLLCNKLEDRVAHFGRRNRDDDIAVSLQELLEVHILV